MNKLRCSKCGGNLYEEKEDYDIVNICLQCGNRQSPTPAPIRPRRTEIDGRAVKHQLFIIRNRRIRELFNGGMKIKGIGRLYELKPITICAIVKNQAGYKDE